MRGHGRVEGNLLLLQRFVARVLLRLDYALDGDLRWRGRRAVECEEDDAARPGAEDAHELVAPLVDGEADEAGDALTGQSHGEREGIAW